MCTWSRSGSPSFATGCSSPSWSSRTGVTVSARPSDAIALALRVGATIYGTEAVLSQAGVAMPDGQEEDPEHLEADVDPAEQETQVEQFREFLDTISPDDFAAGP